MRGRGTWAASVVSRQAKLVATLRKSNNLSTVTLALAADAALGATSITIKSSGSSRLSGKVVAETQFAVAVVIYTTAADSATQPNGNLTLTFSPPLTSAQVVGTVVTFTRSYTETPYKCLLRQVEDIDVKEVSDGHTVRILPFDIGKPAPAQNDLLDGVAIFRVDTVSADDGLGYYLCHIETGTPQ